MKHVYVPFTYNKAEHVDFLRRIDTSWKMRSNIWLTSPTRVDRIYHGLEVDLSEEDLTAFWLTFSNKTDTHNWPAFLLTPDYILK